MKKIFLVLAILFGSIAVKAEVIQQGNSFIQVEAKDTPTSFTYTDKEGRIYPIFKSQKGSFYIVKISKKTGKEYKYYLPKEIQDKIKKQMSMF